MALLLVVDRFSAWSSSLRLPIADATPVGDCWMLALLLALLLLLLSLYKHFRVKEKRRNEDVTAAIE